MKVMMDTQALWLASMPKDVPAFVRRAPLVPYVQHLRACNDALPELALVPSSIRYNPDRTEVGFVLVDMANTTFGTVATGACLVPIVTTPDKIKAHIRHARRLAAAPFC